MNSPCLITLDFETLPQSVRMIVVDDLKAFMHEGIHPWEYFAQDELNGRLDFAPLQRDVLWVMRSADQGCQSLNRQFIIDF